MRFKFTDADIKVIRKNLFIVVDTREQENKHILDKFIDNNIDYLKTALTAGDYSIGIRSTEETKKIGIYKDILFDKDVVVERKANIDEMAGNFKADDRRRIASEFAHLKASGTKVYLFVEDKDFHVNIRTGNYRSEYKPLSLYKSIKAFISRYDLNFQPVDKSLMWSEIFNTLESELIEILKTKGYLDLEYLQEGVINE